MPNFRVTIRTMMGLVVVVSLLLWLGIEARRLFSLSASYRQRANSVEAGARRYSAIGERRKASQANYEKSVAFMLERKKANKFGNDEEYDKVLNELHATYIEKLNTLEFEEILARYNTSLFIKYKHAASHPWEAIPPDPPEPRSSFSRIRPRP